MNRLIPGLLAVCLIAVAAIVLSSFIPGPGSVFFAILIGLLVGNIFPFSGKTDPGTAFAEERILPVAIALMGTELELHALEHLGVSAFMIVIPAMALSIFCALLIGRMLGLSVPASLVLGIGNSVCGSSAVMAAAPAVKAEKHDAAVAVAAVNLLGTIGIFLLPGIAVLLALPEMKTSYLIGGSLQAVGQVVAAGYSVSGVVGDDALVIKMLRVLMIGPIVMILHWIFHSKGTAAGAKKKYVPGYIIGFAVCAIAASVFHNDTWIIPHIKSMAKLLMVAAMAGVGCRIHIRTLLSQGPRALLLVVFLSLIQVGSILFLMRCFLK